MTRLTDFFHGLTGSPHHRSTQAVIASYDDIAPLYETARPSYPNAAIDYIVEFSGVGPSAKLLEIGCGTGKATLLFARKGYRLQGLEPSGNMAAIARDRLACFASASVHAASFEHWDSEESGFDLVYAAQSFHWLDKRRRLELISLRLKKHGTFAAFGNVADISRHSASRAIRVALQRWAPALAKCDPTRDAYSSPESPIYAELLASRMFGAVRFHTFEWRERYSSLSYQNLLNTYSEYRALPPSKLSGLLHDIGAAIDACGGFVDVAYQTGVFTALKR